jgi:AcrR family transcriptional regulator
MSVRAAAVEATRERILDAAYRAFMERWYDDVPLRDVAGDAGVALQTVVNHFGTKEALYGEVSDRFDDSIHAARWTVAPGDVAAIVTTLVDDYERTGEVVLRLLALEDRVPVVRPMIVRGRRSHREWVEHMFGATLTGLRGAARMRRVAQLVVALDVYTWKLLRLDNGLSREHTIAAMREMVEALIDDKQGGSA